LRGCKIIIQNTKVSEKAWNVFQKPMTTLPRLELSNFQPIDSLVTESNMHSLK
jgi:hypothetical protein